MDSKLVTTCWNRDNMTTQSFPPLKERPICGQVHVMRGSSTTTLSTVACGDDVDDDGAVALQLPPLLLLQLLWLLLLFFLHSTTRFWSQRIITPNIKSWDSSAADGREAAWRGL